MKRSPELTPLSHDHHKALFAAQWLRRAEDEGDASATLLGFWTAHGRRHFEIEEGILLPGWFEADPGASAPMAARLAAEHLAIRTGIRHAGNGKLDLSGFRALGSLLDDHVRFEERELFPCIEAGMEADGLSALGREIAEAEGSPAQEVEE